MGNSDSRCAYCRRTCTDGYLSSFCPNEVTCTCKCNVGKGHDVAQKTAAMVGGTAAAVGGAALALATGGTALPIAGAVLGGAGLSSAIHGAVKTAKEEKIDVKEYFIDVGVGALGKGAALGGGAIATEKIASMANCGAKCAFRVPGYTVAALGNAAVEEAGDCAKGKKKWRYYGEDYTVWAKAGTSGVVGGSSSCVKC